MLFITALASSLLVPAVLAGGAMKWDDPEGIPGPVDADPSPDEYFWYDQVDTRTAAMFNALTFVPFEEFSESKQPAVLARDLFAQIVTPEIHELMDPAVVCRGNPDDRVVCSQSIPRGNPKVKTRKDRKNCVNCLFHAGDCSQCPFWDETTESCSSPDSDGDSSDQQCEEKGADHGR